jgi:rod shape-determining protein MreC
MRGSARGLRASLFLILSVALMMLDHRTTAFVKIRVVLSNIVSPLQYVVNAPIDVVSWMSTSLTTQQHLLSENASLKAQQILLQAQLQQLIALQNENSQLRQLMQSIPHTQGVKMLIAKILAVDSDPFTQEVVLDQGTSDGVYVGQPVLDSTGVMGQIISVAGSTSRMMLLSDSRSAIAVEDARNQVRAIALGKGISGELYLGYVSQTTDIQVGDHLISSGLDLRYPAGYPVGVVTKISRDPSEPFVSIDVEPAASLDRSRLVLLLWSDKKGELNE